MTDEVRRRGLAAAEQVVDGLISAVDGPARPTADEPSADDPSRSLPSGLDALGDVWRESVRRLASALGDPGFPAVAPRLDVAGGTASGVVRVAVDPATGSGAAEVWVHNSTTAPIADLVLRCGPPMAPDGAALDPGAVTFDPDRFELPARSSRGVTVAVRGVGSGAVYRTVVQVHGVDDQWLPLELDARGGP